VCSRLSSITLAFVARGIVLVEAFESYERSLGSWIWTVLPISDDIVALAEGCVVEDEVRSLNITRLDRAHVALAP
jgi:hypothetical protein